eukprot:6939865-Prymnesium_polylepis.1
MGHNGIAAAGATMAHASLQPPTAAHNGIAAAGTSMGALPQPQQGTWPGEARLLAEIERLRGEVATIQNSGARTGYLQRVQVRSLLAAILGRHRAILGRHRVLLGRHKPY